MKKPLLAFLLLLTPIFCLAQKPVRCYTLVRVEGLPIVKLDYIEGKEMGMQRVLVQGTEGFNGKFLCDRPQPEHSTNSLFFDCYRPEDREKRIVFVIQLTSADNRSSKCALSLKSMDKKVKMETFDGLVFRDCDWPEGQRTVNRSDSSMAAPHPASSRR